MVMSSGVQILRVNTVKTITDRITNCTSGLRIEEYLVIILDNFHWFCIKNICCGYSLEACHREISNIIPELSPNTTP